MILKKLCCGAAVKIAFLGDSITEGCFELIEKGGEAFDVVYDREQSYAKKFITILRAYFSSSIDYINAGKSGNTSAQALARIDSDVYPYNPDLTIVCLGMNDLVGGEKALPIYTKNLQSIFNGLRDIGSDIIFMTPCSPCEYVDSNRIRQQNLIKMANLLSGLLKEGFTDKLFYAGADAARQCGVMVADCYTLWRRLSACGADVTALLSNAINHPTRDMHWLFANSLAQTLLSGSV